MEMSYLEKLHPTKVFLQGWLAFEEKLLTTDRLMFLDIDMSCTFCTVPESTSHLFFTCGFTNRVWAIIHEWLRIPQQSTTLLNTVKWIKKTRNGSLVHYKEKWLGPLASIFYIWQARNRTIFYDIWVTPREVVHFIKTRAYMVFYNIF